MASKVISCSYDPAGGKSFNAIDPVKPLQTDGNLDISYLVQEIVTKDFGYTGTSKYTLRLKNHKMVLELWNNASGTEKQKYAKIKLENDQWKRGATVLNNPEQTSNRLHHTLDKISRAYRSGQPGARAGADGSAELEATERASRGPVVNNYISCGHPACNHSIDGLQGQLQQQLNALGQRLSELERSIERHQQPRPAQCREHVGKLETTVDSLHEKIAKLQQSIDRLQRENADMKGLRQPLETMSRDVPEALREIRYQLQQLGTLLGERLSVNSNGAQSQMIREMLDGLSKMQAQLAPLAESAASLKTTNSELQRENEALKRQAEAQARELSLKDRKVEELNAKNRAQEETLLKLQAKLDQEKTKHSQLQLLFKDASEANQQVQKECRADNDALKGQLGKLQVAQQKSAQALAEKAQQVEELQQQLADSKAQNETIEQLRQQLEQANEKLVAAQQKNEDSQVELDAAKKAQSNAQEQLEQLRADLTRSRENEARSVRKIEDLQQQNDILSGQLDETNDKLTDAQTQLQEAKDQNSENHEQILTLQGINKKLSAEQASLQKQISDQEALLASATNAARASEQTIEKLNQSLKQKEQELEEQKRAAASAQETAKKAQKENARLQKDLEIQARKLQEAEDSVAYLEDLLDKKSAMHTKALTEKILLESDYNEQTRVTNEMEKLQNEHIRALEEQLTSLQAAASEKIDSTEHQAEVEQLKAQLLKAQQAQEETSRQRELSDTFYKNQNEELRRRVNDLEQQLKVAKDKLVLKKRLAKQQREQAPIVDLRSCPPMPENFSLPSDNAAARVEQLVLSLQQSSDPKKSQTFEEKWLGPMLVNYALLDKSVSAGNVNLWLEGKQPRFQGAQLSAKSQNITNQLKNKPRRIPTTSNTHEKIAGELATAQDKFEKFLTEIEQLPLPVTLASIFGMRKAYIAQAILDYEQTVEPLLQSFESLGPYTGKSRKGGQTIPQRVEGAKRLLGAVKTLRGSLFDMLDKGTWVLA